MKRFLTEKYVLRIISLILFSIPILLMGNKYIVGGDDMKLYYIFPKEYLTNFTFNLISDNTLAGALTGYGTVAYFAPFFAFIWILKTIIPFANTQAIMYGLNFAFGFLFFYKFLSLYVSDKTIEKSRSVTLKIIASFIYLFSPFLNETLFSHQMMHMYLVSLFPVTFYLFFKSIREKKFEYALLSIVVFSLFSTTVNAMPYFGAYIVCLLPLFVYEFLQDKKTFLQYTIASAIVFLGLNLYWIFHFLNSSINNNGLESAFSGETFENENVRIAAGVSRLLSPLNILFQTFVYGTYTISNPLLYLNIYFWGIIVLAGFVAYKKKSTLYSVFLLCLLLSWFFFSPNFPEWGPNIFVWLTKNIPVWGMFRNMYDKFAPALALTFALTVGLSLSILFAKIKNTFFFYTLAILCLFITFLHPPRLLVPWGVDREGLSRISGSLNPDFNDMRKYLSEMENESRVMWLPLNVPTYSFIEDVETNSYYSGLSTLRILADRTDITGKYGFLTQKDIFLGDKVFAWIKEGEYEKVGNILKELNVRYIIVNHQSIPDNVSNFYYGGDIKPYLSIQTGEFTNEILGAKVQDFGSRYTLYEINERYMNDKIMVDKGNLKYTKISSNEYLITISNLNGDSNLSFLEPFNKNWKLYITNDQKDSYIPLQNNVLYEYANNWTLSEKEILNSFSDSISTNPDGSINVTLRLYFQPQKYNMYVYGISFCTFFFTILFLIFRTRRHF